MPKCGVSVYYRGSLFFRITLILLSRVLVPNYIHTELKGTLLTPFSWFAICRITNNGHSDRYEVVHSLDIHFSPNEQWWSFFFFPQGLLPFIYLVYGNVSSGVLPIFQLSCLFCFAAVWYHFCWAGNCENPTWPAFGIQIKCLSVVHGKW